MGDIVNLNRARKQRARSQEAETAAGNRARFGRTKAEKQREAKEAARLKADLDGKKHDEPR